MSRAIRDGVFSIMAADHYSNPEVFNSQEKLLQMLSSDDRPYCLYIAAFRALNDGDTIGAEAFMEQAASLLPESAMAEHTTKTTLMALNKAWFDPAKPWESPDAEAIGRLTAMVGNQNMEMYALNMLKYHHLLDYQEPYILPREIAADTLPIFPEAHFTDTRFVAYPIPASDFIILQYHSDEPFESGKLEIHNTTGMHIRSYALNKSFAQQFINISDLSSGVYILSLTINQNKPLHSKIIVAR
jgi:hypothetical protein